MMTEGITMQLSDDVGRGIINTTHFKEVKM